MVIITNDEAEDRLKFAAKDGNYLMYDFYTEAGPVPGEYKLLVYYDGGNIK